MYFNMNKTKTRNSRQNNHFLMFADQEERVFKILMLLQQLMGIKSLKYKKKMKGLVLENMLMYTDDIGKVVDHKQ